jgi:hypothetical protein
MDRLHTVDEAIRRLVGAARDVGVLSDRSATLESIVRR